MFKHAIAFLSASALATVAATVNSAENKSIEEVLVVGKMSNYSALKSDTPIMDIARSISVETQLEIEEKGALSLDDALAYSSGVFTDVFGFATRGDWAKVRGLQVPQYQDSLQSLFGNYNNSRPGIYTLEQVEVLKGPASVLFGKGSPGGIINVISKRPKEEAAHEVVGEIGSFSRFQLAVDSTGPIAGNDQWLYRFVALKRNSETQIKEVEDDTLILSPSITFRPTDRTELTLLANYNKTESDTGAQFGPLEGTLLPAPNGKKIDHDAYLGIEGFNRYNPSTKSFTFLANHEFNDVFSMEFTARKTKGSVDYRQAWPSFIGRAFGNNERYVYIPGTTSLYKDGTIPRTIYESNSDSDQKAADVRFRANFDTGIVEHQILVGLQYQNVELDSDSVYLNAVGLTPSGITDDTLWINVFNPVNAVNADTLATQLVTSNASYRNASKDKDIGFYISDQITINNFNISAGLRHDKVNNKNLVTGSKQDDSATSGSIGVLYDFDNGFSPYINYAQSFEPVIGDNGANKALKPQEGEQTELGIKYQSHNNKVILTASLFDIDITNLSDPQSRVGVIQQQSGKSSIKGFELEGKAALTDEFKLEFNLTALDAEDQNGEKMVSAVEEQVSTWLSYDSNKVDGLKAGLGLRYNGKVFGGMYSSTQYPTAIEVNSPSHTLVDAMFGYEKANWETTLNVKNLTDKEYYSSCLGRGDCFPGKSRSLVARFKYKF